MPVHGAASPGEAGACSIRCSLGGTEARVRWIPDPVAPCYESPQRSICRIPPEDLYDYWVGDHKIAQLEMLMIAHALLARPQEFRGRRGVWFIENVASLMCLIRGSSDSAELEETCHFIHVVLFALRASLYWEYIPPKSNWADPVSRLGSKDPWHRRESFTRFPSFFNYRLLKLLLAAVIRVVQFL